MSKTGFSVDRGGSVTRLRSAAIAAFCFHLIAGGAMALVLRQGLETNPNLLERLTFIVNHRALWTIAWLTWTAAAMAILNFYVALATVHQTGNFAVFLTVAALAPDLSAQAIEIGVLPTLAERIVHTSAENDLFITLHRTAVMLSGFAANGLYSLSALILAWKTRRTYPAWVWIAGTAVGCLGLMLSAAALRESVPGMFWTNVFLLPCILLWLGGVAASGE
jgi:hypothetical protein